ncbi:hypothetical protein [Mucilaginibacter metallidurans]|uniref:hypothetical protein n=1 Tax=Mucilaginibacter sp. P4 TaxID=3383180 RepID=UPI001FCBDD08|nr:hypothetical protein [Mucilaginibacter gossypii]
MDRTDTQFAPFSDTIICFTRNKRICHRFYLFNTTRSFMDNDQTVAHGGPAGINA